MKLYSEFEELMRSRISCTCTLSIASVVIMRWLEEWRARRCTGPPCAT